MAFGWKNPMPFWVGGDPTPTEQIYDQLRVSVGTLSNGASALGPVDGVRDRWWQSVAQTRAASISYVEAAMGEFFPARTTPGLPAWEKLLFLPREATDAERRAALELAIANVPDATILGLLDSLQTINADFTILPVDPDRSVIVQLGKAFGPLPGASGQVYSSGQASRQATDWPNYADDFVVHVACLATTPATDLAKAETMLNFALPAWIDFQIVNVVDGPDGEGFYFDGGPDGSSSVFDLTAFGP